MAARLNASLTSPEVCRTERAADTYVGRPTRKRLGTTDAGGQGPRLANSSAELRP